MRAPFALCAALVVPDDDAPRLAPASQARAVEVLAGDVTAVVLSFDTGVR
jgi:hypothetical protein